MFWTPGPKRRPKRCFQDPFRANATPTRAPEPLQNDARNDVSRIRSEPTQHLHELRKHFKTTSETTLPGSVRNQCNPYTTSGGAPKRRPKLHFQDPFRTNATFFSSNKFVFFSIPDCVSHSRARVSCRALRAVPCRCPLVLVLQFTLNNNNDNANPGHIQVCCLGGAPPSELAARQRVLRIDLI